MTGLFSLQKHWHEAGLAVVPDVLDAGVCRHAAELVPSRKGESAGTRSLLTLAWCASLVGTIRHHPLISSLIPANFVTVQCTYFEKTISNNWLVTMHQDLSIPVAERVSAPELSGWSEKEGRWFVQAPESTLERLIAARLHLDDCGRDDGALRVIAGSHHYGRLPMERIAGIRDSHQEVLCEARIGDVLLMRPLLLHASSKATGSSRRRVLHFLFGPPELPHGLRWCHAL